MDGQLQDALCALLQHHVRTMLSPSEGSPGQSSTEAMQSLATTAISGDVASAAEQPSTCIVQLQRALATPTCDTNASESATHSSNNSDTTMQLQAVLDVLDRILSSRADPLPTTVVLATITTVLDAINMSVKAALTTLLQAVCANPQRPALLPLLRAALAHASGLATAAPRVDAPPPPGSGDAMTHALPADEDDGESTASSQQSDHAYVFIYA